MIIDSLDHFQRWVPVHAGFDRAFSGLREVSQQGAEPGNHVIVPDRLWIIVESACGRTKVGAKLEAHRRYVDIQLVLRGEERIGWRPLEDCSQPTADYDPARDIVFFADLPTTWTDLVPGQFAIFFPSDAHAPLAGDGEVLKAIAKVAVDW